MKRVRITFDYDGLIVTAIGTVLDSLYVNNLIYEIRDHNEESVHVDRNISEDIKELSEQLLIEKYNDLELRF